MKTPYFVPSVFALILALGLFLLPANELAAAEFKCSSKVSSCGNPLQGQICSKFYRASMKNQKECSNTRQEFKDSCPNPTCYQGMNETFDSCMNSASKD